MVNFNSKMLVHILILIFGSGAWIAVNGVWVELPTIVSQTPEMWALASYLTVISQIANIGPIIVTVMQACCSRYYRQNAMIYSILVIGTCACVLLCFFWNETAIVAGEERSVALFTLWFALAFVDCSSSVTYLPFMTVFQSSFLTTYFIGEGLSGFLPSIFALIQGVGGYSCINETFYNESSGTNQSHVVPEYEQPRFSTEVFFGLVAVMMGACGTSFLLLNHSSFARKHFAAQPRQRVAVETYKQTNSAETSLNNNDDGEEEIAEPEPAQESTTTLLNKQQLPLSSRNYLFLLAIIFFINGVSNGVLPSVSTYSSLPYGELPYHLATTLGSMANPAACFVAVFRPMRKFRVLGLLTVFAAGFGSYLMLLAVQSPCPILVSSAEGATLMVLAQILFTFTVSYLKVSIAVIFRARGTPKSLVWYGATVQAGSFIGAITMFLLVNSTVVLFTSGAPCVNECV